MKVKGMSCNIAIWKFQVTLQLPYMDCCGYIEAFRIPCLGGGIVHSEHDRWVHKIQPEPRPVSCDDGTNRIQTTAIKPVTEHDRWTHEKNGGARLERTISRKLELVT